LFVKVLCGSDGADTALQGRYSFAGQIQLCGADMHISALIWLISSWQAFIFACLIRADTMLYLTNYMIIIYIYIYIDITIMLMEIYNKWYMCISLQICFQIFIYIIYIFIYIFIDLLYIYWYIYVNCMYVYLFLYFT